MTDDLLKRAETFLNVCGACDLGMPTLCNCPTGDSRPVMLDLVREVERLRDQLATASRRVRYIADYGDPATAKALTQISDEIAEAVR